MRIQDILGPIRTLKHRLIGTSGSVPHRYFMQFLPDDPVIIEAGAYNGGDTYELARRWPRGHIHAFEPVPELFEAVKQQTSNVKNVSYYPIALGEKNGTAEFFARCPYPYPLRFERNATNQSPIVAGATLRVRRCASYATMRGRSITSGVIPGGTCAK